MERFDNKNPIVGTIALINGLDKWANLKNKTMTK